MIALLVALLQVAPAVPDTTAASAAAGQQQEPAPPRWGTSLTFGFTSSSGNSDLMALNAGIRVRHLQTRRYKLDWTAAFRYGESQGEVVARNMQSKLDFDMGADARVAPFIFASGERDAFRRLDLRARTGSGVRYAFYRGETGEASVRLAGQFSHERFTPEAVQDPRSDAGWSMELKALQQLGDAVRFENSTMFDPILGDIADFTLELKSKVTSRISRRLALTLEHTYSYDSTPPPEVRTTDQRFQAGLTIDF